MVKKSGPVCAALLLLIENYCEFSRYLLSDSGSPTLTQTHTHPIADNP